MATAVTPNSHHPVLPAAQIASSQKPKQQTAQQQTPTTPSLNKRGHIRSASLENANAILSKNTLGLPLTQAGHTGTLKSRNEQKRMRNKFGSHSNLEEFVQQGRNKFQNIRQMFELTKNKDKKAIAGGGVAGSNSNVAAASDVSTSPAIFENDQHSQMQSLPPMMTTSLTNYPQMRYQHQQQQQQQQQYQQQQQQMMNRKASLTTPTQQVMASGYGSSGMRSSIADINERLNIIENVDAAAAAAAGNNNSNNNNNRNNNKLRLAQQQQQQQQQQQLHQHQQQQQQIHQQHLQQQQHQQQLQNQRLHTALVHSNNQHQQLQQRSSSDLAYKKTMEEQQQQQQQQPQQQQPQIQEQQSSSAIATTPTTSTATPSAAAAAETAPAPATTTTNLLRPIAFKPIPFEPDYSLSTANHRYCDVVTSSQSVTAVPQTNVVDRYGSTPSLAAGPGSNMRFGSTTDLRHGGSSVGSMGGFMTGGGVGAAAATAIGGGGGSSNITNGNVGFVGGYSSNNYCNSLMARRRGSRSLKINDSMESIRHTPDSDVNSQSGTIKSNASNKSSNSNSSSSTNGIGITDGPTLMSNSLTMANVNTNKYPITTDDMTPSPSDSGISDLETALKDRDSELSYLRQTMEHNEKDKENFWENETKRLKLYYEAQQREYMLKLKKMEQMLAMQQFQFKQHKLRHSEQTQKLREQVAELKNEYEILKTNNISIKHSERNLKDRSAYIEEQLEETQNTIERLKAQLEESEWKVCERNGELALLKTQLKEATNELTLKEHAIVHLKHENNNAESQIYQSLQENHKITQQHKHEEQQKAQSKKEKATELKQLNKIIILKDQVILALTNELAKLRKELSDLAIFHEYGEEPSGKYTRLKQQLDNLTDICNKTRKHTQQRIDLHQSQLKDEKQDVGRVIDDCNLEVIMNCLKIAPALSSNSELSAPLSPSASSSCSSGAMSEQEELELNKLNAEKRLAKMSADIQNFVYGAHNLPDVALNLKCLQTKFPNNLEESTLDHLIEESASYAEEIGKLRKQLDDVRVNFELEKRQWSTEKEKVLQYQKQLQTHYINMYQKLRNLEKSNEV